MQNVGQALTRHLSGFSYLLQSAQGHKLAGNNAGLDPTERVREWGPPARWDARAVDGARSWGYLFVGWSTLQLHDMEDFIAASFRWGLIVSIALSVAVGVLVGGRLSRKIVAVSETGCDIIDGDLTRRVPVKGRSDALDRLAWRAGRQPEHGGKRVWPQPGFGSRNLHGATLELEDNRPRLRVVLEFVISTDSQ